MVSQEARWVAQVLSSAVLYPIAHSIVLLLAVYSFVTAYPRSLRCSFGTCFSQNKTALIKAHLSTKDQAAAQILVVKLLLCKTADGESRLSVIAPRFLQLLTL
jgi:hypothetical protein